MYTRDDVIDQESNLVANTCRSLQSLLVVMTFTVLPRVLDTTYALPNLISFCLMLKQLFDVPSGMWQAGVLADPNSLREYTGCVFSIFVYRILRLSEILCQSQKRGFNDLYTTATQNYLDLFRYTFSTFLANDVISQTGALRVVRGREGAELNFADKIGVPENVPFQ